MRSLFALLVLTAMAHADTPKLDDEGWRVQANGPKSSKVGQHAALEIVVEARAGYHLNDDYPLNWKPTSNDAVAFDAVRVDKAAAKLEPCDKGGHDCRAKVPVGFVGKSAGVTHVAGTVAFSACNDAHCLIEKVPVVVDVAIR